MFPTTNAATEEGNGNIHTSTTNISSTSTTTTTTTGTIEQNLLDQVRYLYGLYYSVYIYVCA